MKTKIKNLIQSYFYFNRLEQQGVYLLLFFILLTWLFKLWLPVLFKPKPLQFTYTLAVLPKEPNTYKNFNKGKSNSFDSIQPPKEKKTLLKVIELNSADSLQILSLYRVGPALTSKIIQYRIKLGGYVHVNQLSEIYGFNEDLLYDLEDKIIVNAKLAKKINLNTITFDELKTHPYFKFVLSKQIVNYRQTHGLYKKIEDLKGIKTVNDSILELIKPYVFL